MHLFEYIYSRLHLIWPLKAGQKHPAIECNFWKRKSTKLIS